MSDQIIQLQVHHHNHIYLSFELGTFEMKGETGDLVFEGPYITATTEKGSASIKVKELVQNLLENLEPRHDP